MILKENRKRKYFQVIGLFVTGLVFYVFLGQEWISIQDDSVFYLQMKVHEGVMPLYPLFIFTLKYIFGETVYLHAVVIAQSLLAVGCTMIFTLYLQKQFLLRNWESFLLYFLCALPFTIYLPESGITHQILTEGLAYALFYLYFICILQYIFLKRHGWGIAAVGMSCIMSLVRSQLLFLLVITFFVFMIVQFINTSKNKVHIRMIKLFLSCLGGVTAIAMAVALVYQINGYYLSDLLPAIRNYEAGTEENAGSNIEENINPSKENGELKKENKQNHKQPSQFTTILMIRGFYEADEADEELFDTPEMREIFNRVYRAVDEKQYRYEYARQDLYIWKDLICDRITTVAYEEIHAYLQENPDVNLDAVSIVRELGIKVLLKHFDRYLYHTLRMMISGFISSIFFQIEPIYLLCHFITLALYLLAVLGSILCFNKRNNKKAPEFMMITLIFLIGMVTIVNIVFFGLQRYMVYAMGIFYCALYLTGKEIFCMVGDKYPDKKIFQAIQKIF